MLISVSGKINSGKDTIGQIIKIILDNPHLNNEGVLNFIDKEIYNNEKSPYYSSWEIKKFADKLKDIVCILLGCTRKQLEDREFKEKELGEEWWYYTRCFHGDIAQDLIPYSKDFYHKDLDKMSLIKLTPRKLLQLLGTECGRQIIHPNIWVNALMSEYKPSQLLISKIRRKGFGISPQKLEESLPKWIITDIRFPNELKAVKDRGGISIRVNRSFKHKVESVGGRFSLGHDVTPLNEHESETSLDSAIFDYVIQNNGTIEELVQKVKEVLIKEKLL